MSLDEAVAAALSDCPGCSYDLSYSYATRAAAEESARRGLVEMTVSDRLGGGFVGLWAYSDEGWQMLTGYQTTVPMPHRLPAEIWICVEDSHTRTRVRSGPGTEYPVITLVDGPTVVEATFMHLTKPQTIDAEGYPVDGEGWFEVANESIRGWVSSTRVDQTPMCDLWLTFEEWK